MTSAKCRITDAITRSKSKSCANISAFVKRTCTPSAARSSAKNYIANIIKFCSLTSKLKSHGLTRHHQGDHPDLLHRLLAG